MAAEEPRFGVIVPTYNAGRDLDECLASLERLDEPAGGYAVTVVDGGSSDGTVAIARERDVHVLEAPDTGVAEARNRAAAETDAEVLVFVDADCRAPAELLTAAEPHIDDHGAVGAFYEPTPEQGWVARTWLAVERKPAGRVGWVPAGTMAVPRAVFEAVGGFREDLRASEDVDLCRRLRAEGHAIRHEPAMACEHLGQPDTLGGFFANERGRSASLVRSVREADGLDAEHATLVLALAHVLAPAALLVAGPLAGPLGLAGVLAVLLAPTLAWSLLAARSAGWRRWPQVLALLVVYNVARAVSLVEHAQWRDVR